MLDDVAAPGGASRSSTSPDRRADGDHRRTAVLSAVLLGATLGVPAVAHLDRELVALTGIAGAVVLLGLGARRFSRHAAGRPFATLGQLVLHLSPVILLTTVFPLVSEDISNTRIGGVSLTSVVLASSMTVPWLSQSVCMPLYRGIGEHLHAGDRDALVRTFCRVWPLVALRGLSVIALFAVPVQLVMQWPLSVLGAYVALALAHLFFVQLLVLANTPDQRWLWAAAWTGYAAALFLVPTLWFLPPLAGIAVLLVPLRRHIPQLARPMVLDGRDVFADLVRGLLLGAVLWADKLLFFLTGGRQFDVDTVFLALLPAVLAYNVYFVVLAPRFDRDVAAMRAAMENEPLHRLDDHSGRLAATVTSTIAQTALAGAAIGFVVSCLVAAWVPDVAALTAAVSVASWTFMITTVVSYKLDYVGQRRTAQAFGAVHLAACVAAFALLPPGPLVYLVLAAVDLLVFTAALRSCLRHWGSPEYTLFWRHATSW
jgi:hypothetical protein